MGLDMWFYSSKNVPAEVTDEMLNEENERINNDDTSEFRGVRDKYRMEEIQYFRKHSDLHGFLENYWTRKTGAIDCNCAYIEITRELLSEMLRLSQDNPTEHCVGPFWGMSDSENWSDTYDMCRNIEDRFQDGERVFYYCWY